jgi:hypothetical protein
MKSSFGWQNQVDYFAIYPKDIFPIVLKFPLLLNPSDALIKIYINLWFMEFKAFLPKLTPMNHCH